MPAFWYDCYRHARKPAKVPNSIGLALPVELSDVNFAPKRGAEFAPLRKLKQSLRERWREPWAIPWGSSGTDYRGEQQDLAGKVQI